MVGKILKSLSAIFFFLISPTSVAFAHDGMHLPVHQAGQTPINFLPYIFLAALAVLTVGILRNKRYLFSLACIASLTAVTFTGVVPQKFVCAVFFHESTFQATDHDCCSTAALPASTPNFTPDVSLLLSRLHAPAPRAADVPLVLTANPRAPPIG